MEVESEFIREWFPDQDADDFFLKVQLAAIWDEEQFLRMERIAHRVLDLLEREPAQRARWRAAFTEEVTRLRDLLMSPAFLAQNYLALTNEQYGDYIAARARRLDGMRERYEALAYRDA